MSMRREDEERRRDPEDAFSPAVLPSCAGAERISALRERKNMILAKIIGDVVSDQKIEDYEGRKMLIVQPITPEGEPTGKTFLAVDGVQAGVGDTVLIMDEGGSARMLLDTEAMTIRAVVAGVVDEIHREI